MATNEFERNARLRKAHRLADALHAAGFTPATVDLLDAPARARVCADLGVHAASETTWRLVLELLADKRTVEDRTARKVAAMANALPADPFAGLR